ncbi:zinc finger, CCHC-type containing protein [Tanacetum coccineum]
MLPRSSRFQVNIESGKGSFIYVDDMLIFGTDQDQVYLENDFLSSSFSMKDMGEADVILGIRIKHEINTISTSQSHYIEKILKKFNYFDSTPVSTLMDTSKLSRYTSNPSTQHWQAVQWVLKYLKKIMDCSLSYIEYPLVLEVYTNASWIRYAEDNSSTSDCVFLLGGGAISWASKKKTCITSSTIESEFVALKVAGKKVEWLKNLILEISLWSKLVIPIAICCDSATTLAKAYSQIYNRKSRHLGVRYNMIRELITNEVISRVCKVSTKSSWLLDEGFG